MNSRKESFIGMASENDLRIALHYEDAFYVLYNSNAYQDHIVMPALFLVRQFLELGLKYNIKNLATISGVKNLEEKLTSIHDLLKLHNSFLDHYKNAKKKKNITNVTDTQLLDDLDALITMISVFDNGSMGYRYSEDKKGSKQIDSNETYNLENVKNLLGKVSNLFTYTEEILV